MGVSVCPTVCHKPVCTKTAKHRITGNKQLQPADEISQYHRFVYKQKMWLPIVTQNEYHKKAANSDLVTQTTIKHGMFSVTYHQLHICMAPLPIIGHQPNFCLYILAVVSYLFALTPECHTLEQPLLPSRRGPSTGTTAKKQHTRTKQHVSHRMLHKIQHGEHTASTVTFP